MKTLQPFFKAYWQTAAPFFILLSLLEFLKPGFVQSRVHMTIFFVTIVIVFTLDTVLSRVSSTQE